MTDEECLFCKISIDEIPSKKIYENDGFFSIPDKNPKTEGHSLVISKNHFSNTLELPDTLGSELLDCIKKTTIKIMSKTNSEGFNIINNNFESAGQVINHIHYHIIPRKGDDGLKNIC